VSVECSAVGENDLRNLLNVKSEGFTYSAVNLLSLKGKIFASVKFSPLQALEAVRVVRG
jgi:hypothetical protein